jgi:hypothetical protein
MEPYAAHESPTRNAPLVVADWTIDAEAVVVACRALVEGGTALQILVPAWLHGIDWAGDPFASVPCARRQLERITELCRAAGFPVDRSAVGDPDPISAICDTVAAGGVGEILLFASGRHVSSAYPLSVARRAARLTGLPLQSFATATPPRTQRRRRFAAGHCELSHAAHLARGLG